MSIVVFKRSDINLRFVVQVIWLIKYLIDFKGFIFHSLEVVLVSGRSLHMSYG